MAGNFITGVRLFPSDILGNMLNYQRSQIPTIGKYGRLDLEDLLRIANRLDADIFKDTGCTRFNAASQQVSFHGEKVPLNRLLYHNFIGDVNPGDLVINSCENKGACCNIRHIKKKIRAPDRSSRKLTDDQVIQVCAALRNNESVSDIALRFGVSRVAINNIRIGRTHVALTKSMTVDFKKPRSA